MRERPLVLTVDDDRTFLGSLAILLERLHCEVLPVANGDDAMELARVMRPRAIVLSLQLAAPDGLTFLRNLRDSRELVDTPVVMVTAHREKHQVWEAMRLGCIEVLDKPIELTALHQALQRCNLYPDARRRYLRAPYRRPVEVIIDGVAQLVNAVTLSERGIMVRMPQPLPKGTEVEVRLSLPGEQVVQAGGEVIYVRMHQGVSAAEAEVAIRFDRLNSKGVEALQMMVRQLLVGDLDASREAASIVKPE